MKTVAIIGGIITAIRLAGIVIGGAFVGRDQYVAITGAIILAAGMVSHAISLRR